MSLGRRVFLVDGDAVTPVALKAFDDFYLRGMTSLPQYANRMLSFAVVSYKLERKKPREIVSIDCLLMRVNADGGIDSEFELDGMRLIADMLDGGSAAQPTEFDGGGHVVNAVRKFDEKRREHRYPTLSGAAHKRILDILFK